MPKINKVEKTVSSISLTNEAWAILHQRSQEAQLSKSEYIENLVRNANMTIYELVRKYLIEHYKNTDKEIQEIRQTLDQLEAENQTIREFLKLIGVSPNQIP